MKTCPVSYWIFLFWCGIIDKVKENKNEIILFRIIDGACLGNSPGF